MAACRQLQNISSAEAVKALSQVGAVWDYLFPHEKHRIANLMISRVDLVPEGLKVTWHALGWRELIGEFSPKEIKLLEAV